MATTTPSAMTNDNNSTSSSSSIVLVVDGSRGEGGGQVLRNAISYATIMQRGLEVQNIRAGRSKPGLAAQHVTGLRLAAQICGGVLQGNEIRSQRILYTPLPQNDDSNKSHHLEEEEEGYDDQRTLVGDIGTAGSICLLLQAALPCALFGSATPCRLILKGGTNAALAPQYDYWEHVFWPTIMAQQSSMPSDQVRATMKRRGYFPRGGGEVQICTTPWKQPIHPIVLTERGDLCQVYIRSFVAGKVPRHVAEDMVKSARSTLRRVLSSNHIRAKVDVVTETQAQGSGSGILIVAKTTTGCILAGSALGGPKKRAKDTGIEAASELISTLNDGGCVDEWLQDQLILFMALANGTSRILTGSLTLHTQTAIWVAEELCGAKFKVTKLSDDSARKPALVNGKEDRYGKEGRISGRHLICCEGIGFVNAAFRGRTVQNNDNHAGSKRKSPI